jgi:hypothetical protein
MTPKYIRKKTAQPKEIWLFTEALWSRGDFVEVPVDEAEVLLGIKKATVATPAVITDSDGIAIPDAIADTVETVEEKPAATPLFTLKRVALGHYAVLDSQGNVVVTNIRKVDAEAKIAELSA